MQSRLTCLSRWFLILAAIWLHVPGQATAFQRQPCAVVTQQEPAIDPDLSVAWSLCMLVESGRLEEMRLPSFGALRSQLKDFYLSINYVPVWIAEGRPTPRALLVISILKNAEQKGLNPEDYDGSQWSQRLATLASATSGSAVHMAARFDLGLTVCLARYICHLHKGRIESPAEFGPEGKRWDYNPFAFIAARVLTTSDVAATLEEVEPPYPGYRRTEKALQQYLALSNGGREPQLL